MKDAFADLDSVIIDSAGTATGHAGQPMHPLAHAALGKCGYDGSGHTARQFDPSWERDLIFAMDSKNLAVLQGMGAANVCFFGETPDPYFGGAADFAHALDLIMASMPAIVTLVSAMLVK